MSDSAINNVANAIRFLGLCIVRAAVVLAKLSTSELNRQWVGE